MINRKQQEQIESLWTESDSVSLSPAARLERKTDAFLTAMRAIMTATENVQIFWDNTDLLTLMLAAEPTEALDSGGTVTKASVYKYQVLFLSFKEWLAAPTAANVLGSPEELTETPRQLIMRQPEKVA